MLGTSSNPGVIPRVINELFYRIELDKEETKNEWVYKITFSYLEIYQEKVNIALVLHIHSKTCVKQPLKNRPHLGFQDQLLLNAGQKFCRMPLEHSAILLTFIKLPFVIKIFVLSILSGRFIQV